MSARRQYRRQHPRHITVRGVRRDTPDLHKLARVLISLAEAQAEQEAQEQAGNPCRTQSTNAAEDSDV